MNNSKMLHYIKEVLNNMPTDWQQLTTHRLDIYDESKAKTQFLNQFETLFEADNASASSLNELPTAYDYIRLGHPLSCILEWAMAHLNGIKADHVITFSSNTTPILAILRKNLFENKNTQICYTGELPANFKADKVKSVYGYQFDAVKVANVDAIPDFDGSTIYMSENNDFGTYELSPKVDFYLNIYDVLGSVLLVNGANNESYVSEIQHVRRRETIAMTPVNAKIALDILVGNTADTAKIANHQANKTMVENTIKEITATATKPLMASSGLSMQYAIMMGLVDHAQEQHKGKAIKFIVPPNCYGGTNDQARRVAACIHNVEVVDLPVDGDNDMVSSIDTILSKIAKEDAVPYIIAEIPTNPRVEVPNLADLKAALSKVRHTASGAVAITPVFILDQTFCPNVHFLSEGEVLSTVSAISYASGSKFPSGGLCTAGYCASNELAANLMVKIEEHLVLCDNEATALQMEILANQLPSMNQRIKDAYVNTRYFVNFIEETLPSAKINFVSEELAKAGFTPSVFSLDLPTKGSTDAEKEAYKRALNLKLINLMITNIPTESKFCVSYGQLKGCYWTIPATSTQGTTKEGDKDYIVRVALSANMNMAKHKQVFADFVASI